MTVSEWKVRKEGSRWCGKWSPFSDQHLVFESNIAIYTFDIVVIVLAINEVVDLAAILVLGAV
jgi:hypothetical protein